MQPLRRGIYAAALTPMKPDLSVDAEELVRHCKDLIKRGCTGVAIFGTTEKDPLCLTMNVRLFFGKLPLLV